MTSFLDEFYQDEKSANKDMLWVLIISLILFVIFLSLFLFNLDKHTLLSFIASSYIISIIFTMCSITASMYWFTRVSGKNHLKVIKYSWVYFSLFLIILIFLPYTILGSFSKIMKFKSAFQNYSFYLMSLFLILIIDYILFPIILLSAEYYNIDIVTSVNSAVIGIYFIDLIIAKLLAFFRYLFISRKSNDVNFLRVRILYLQTMKELKVLNYGFITIITFFNIIYAAQTSWSSGILSTLTKSILIGIALFISLDTIFDKWNVLLNSNHTNEKNVLKMIRDDIKIVNLQIKNCKSTKHKNCYAKVIFTYPIDHINFFLEGYSKKRYFKKLISEINSICKNGYTYSELITKTDDIISYIELSVD